MRPNASRLWLLVLVFCLLGCQTAKMPRTLSTIPSFVLNDQNGQPFNIEMLKGKPFVVGFLFTSCMTLCPKLVAAMKRLDEELVADGQDVHFVAISVDPETDTPARLKTYAEKQGLDLRRWTLLTGNPKDVREAVVGALMSPMGEKEVSADGLLEIAHGGQLLLIDGDRGLRGIYLTDDDALAALRQAVRLISGS
jgi:protein SCO1/2